MGRPIRVSGRELAGMSQKPPEKTTKKRSLTSDREARLAAALRANLRRRKMAGSTNPSPEPGKPVSDGE
jgi:hypothetical protein